MFTSWSPFIEVSICLGPINVNMLSFLFLCIITWRIYLSSYRISWRGFIVSIGRTIATFWKKCKLTIVNKKKGKQNSKHKAKTYQMQYYLLRYEQLQIFCPQCHQWSWLQIYVYPYYYSYCWMLPKWAFYSVFFLKPRDLFVVPKLSMFLFSWAFYPYYHPKLEFLVQKKVYNYFVIFISLVFLYYCVYERAMNIENF